MLRPIAKLLALIALVLMPLSMGSAPAAAHARASAPASHCDEHQKPADTPGGYQLHCTACAALPAMDAPMAIAELRPETPLRTELTEFVTGIEPEIATPPPKAA